MRYKVTHVLPDFGPGGAERMAVHLMTNVDISTFDVSAVSLFAPVGTDMDRQLAESGIRVTYLGKKLGFDPTMYAKLSRVLKGEKPDILHTHRYVLRYLVPVAALSHSRPIVHTVHTLAEKEVGLLGQVVHRIAFRTGVVPVGIANEVSASLRRVYGLKEFPQINNGIPVNRYEFPTVSRSAWRRREGFDDGEVLFVCVARLSEPKNHDLLIRAFAEGPARGSHHARLLLVGVGVLHEPLEELARNLGVADKVRFMGFRTDIPDLLGASDVFVLASSWEGNPLSVMEAMAAGKPVIATAVGGVPELVRDGSTGVLVEPGNKAALAKAMARMAADPGMVKSLGVAATAAAGAFDTSCMVKSYEGLYLSLLSGKRPR